VVGITLTGLSIVVTLWLARAKRRTGQAMNSRLVLADAAGTLLCAWPSVSTLCGRRLRLVGGPVDQSPASSSPRSPS
jgi:divalent metal cation (Fe/Co/Zn/Cd) transporter